MTEEQVWKCKDGRKIKISEMADSHLENVINKIHRSNGWRREWLDELYKEYDKRQTFREKEDALREQGKYENCYKCNNSGFYIDNITELEDRKAGMKRYVVLACRCSHGQNWAVINGKRRERVEEDPTWPKEV